MTKLQVLGSKAFWDDTIVRAVRTFFQAALAFVGVNAISVVEIDYAGAGAVGAGAALVSIAQSIIRVSSVVIDEDPVDVEEAVEEIADDNITKSAN